MYGLEIRCDRVVFFLFLFLLFGARYASSTSDTPLSSTRDTADSCENTTYPPAAARREMGCEMDDWSAATRNGGGKPEVRWPQHHRMGNRFSVRVRSKLAPSQGTPNPAAIHGDPDQYKSWSSEGRASPSWIRGHPRRFPIGQSLWALSWVVFARLGADGLGPRQLCQNCDICQGLRSTICKCV